MSRANSPKKDSPSKHKGLKTSLYGDNVQRLDNNIYTTNPNRIFVQTVNEQPNVLPYIDSTYSNQQQHGVGHAQSEYRIVNQRQNNFITTVRPGVVTNVRVSPISGNYRTNLSHTKVEVPNQSRAFNASTYVPPPPESFLIPNSKITQNRSPSLGKTVITSSPMISSIPVQLPVQSVKKTFVPHHIINQIPVYTGAVYAESGYRSSDHQQQSSGNDESQQVLMGYYDKLYQKYEVQRQRNAGINQQLSGAINEINHLRSQLQSQSMMQTTTIVSPPQSRKIIDKKRLHDLLMSKWSRVVDGIIDIRKQNCLRQVYSMVENNRITIKIPGEYVQETTSVTYHAQ